MTPAELNKLINFYCFGSVDASGDDNFPQADKLLLINIFKNDIAKAIVGCNEDYFGMLFTRPLVAGRREYGIPDEVLNTLKYVEAKLDGVNWSHLDEFDLNSYKRPTDEANIIAQFSGRKPMFDIFRRSLWLYTSDAIIDVAGGLKLWAIIYPADITDLTSTIDMSVDPTSTSQGFPRQFHELLARRVGISYRSSQDKPKVLNEKELFYKADLQDALDAITGMNMDRSIIRTLPSDDGQNY